MERIKLLRPSRAVKMGYSRDRRKRRHQHRQNAQALLRGGTMLNSPAPRGSIPWQVAQWHLFQARYL